MAKVRPDAAPPKDAGAGEASGGPSREEKKLERLRAFAQKKGASHLSDETLKQLSKRAKERKQQKARLDRTKQAHQKTQSRSGLESTNKPQTHETAANAKSRTDGLSENERRQITSNPEADPALPPPKHRPVDAKGAKDILQQFLGSWSDVALSPEEALEYLKKFEEAKQVKARESRSKQSSKQTARPKTTSASLRNLGTAMGGKARPAKGAASPKLAQDQGAFVPDHEGASSISQAMENVYGGDASFAGMFSDGLGGFNLQAFFYTFLLNDSRLRHEVGELMKELQHLAQGNESLEQMIQMLVTERRMDLMRFKALLTFFRNTTRTLDTAATRKLEGTGGGADLKAANTWFENLNAIIDGKKDEESDAPPAETPASILGLRGRTRFDEEEQAMLLAHANKTRSTPATSLAELGLDPSGFRSGMGLFEEAAFARWEAEQIRRNISDIPNTAPGYGEAVAKLRARYEAAAAEANTLDAKLQKTLSSMSDVTLASLIRFREKFVVKDPQEGEVPKPVDKLKDDARRYFDRVVGPHMRRSKRAQKTLRSYFFSEANDPDAKKGEGEQALTSTPEGRAYLWKVLTAKERAQLRSYAAKNGLADMIKSDEAYENFYSTARSISALMNPEESWRKAMVGIGMSETDAQEVIDLYQKGLDEVSPKLEVAKQGEQLTKAQEERNELREKDPEAFRKQAGARRDEIMTGLDAKGLPLDSDPESLLAKVERGRQQVTQWLDSQAKNPMGTWLAKNTLRNVVTFGADIIDGVNEALYATTTDPSIRRAAQNLAQHQAELNQVYRQWKRGADGMTRQLLQVLAMGQSLGG